MSSPSDDMESDEARARATRGQQRYTRDQQWTAATRAGDRQSFGRLVEAWLDPAHDRVVQFGIPADDRSAVLSGGFEDVRLELELGAPAPFTSLLVRSLILRTGAPRPVLPLGDGAAEQRAAERLTRGTDIRGVATDPSVAAVLWEAAALLGPENRDILDLHWRHLLTADEIAAAIEVPEDRVQATIDKLPEGFTNVVRARLLWAGGKPRNKDLAKALKAAGVTVFDAKAVRTIHSQAKDNSVLRAQSLIALSPAEVFAQIPVVSAPTGIRRDVIVAVTAGIVPAAAEPEVFEPESEDQAARSGIVAAGATAYGAAALAGTAAQATEPEPATPNPFAAAPAEPFAPSAGAPAAPAPADQIENESSAGTSRADKAAATFAAVAAAAEKKEAAAAAEAGTGPTVGTTSASGLATRDPASADARPVSTSDRPDDARGALGPIALEGAAGAAAAAAIASSVPSIVPTTPPTLPTPPAPPRAPGAVHAPISRDTEEEDAKRKKLVLAGAIAAAVLIFGGLAFALTSGGSSSDDLDTASPTTVENKLLGSTSSTSSTSTTAPPETTTTTLVVDPASTNAFIVAPTVPPTVAPSGGGGSAPPPPPTSPPTTVTGPAQINLQFGAGMTVDGVAGSGQTLTAPWVGPRVSIGWNVTASVPLTVSLTGPGVNRSDAGTNGSQAVCPTGGTGSCTPEPGQYTYTLKVFADGKEVGSRSYSFNVTLT